MLQWTCGMWNVTCQSFNGVGSKIENDNGTNCDVKPFEAGVVNRSSVSEQFVKTTELLMMNSHAPGDPKKVCTQLEPTKMLGSTSAPPITPFVNHMKPPRLIHCTKWPLMKPAPVEWPQYPWREPVPPADPLVHAPVAI